MIRLELSSHVAADRSTVWDVVSTMAGVNAELLPMIRMTTPRGGDRIDEATLAAGDLDGRCWVLLLGVLPFDRHHFDFASVTDGQGFEERSTSWVNRRWHHDRTLEDGPVAGTCVVTDRLGIEPRMRLAVPVTRMVVGAIFRHRHRRLRKRFGEA